MSKKISIFNPFAGAYCELDIELAKKFVASAREVEKQKYHILPRQIIAHQGTYLKIKFVGSEL